MSLVHEPSASILLLKAFTTSDLLRMFNFLIYQEFLPEFQEEMAWERKLLVILSAHDFCSYYLVRKREKQKNYVVIEQEHLPNGVECF